MNVKNSVLFYAAVCVVLLPVILLRDFTPANELRYLSIADEALRNHTFFAFTNHGVPYADKPPLYLWIVMLCRWMTGGHHLWLLSLFSLLPAFGVILVMDRWTEQKNHLAGLMLMTSAYFLGAAVVLRMDMLMCFFIVLSLREFWRIWVLIGNRNRVEHCNDEKALRRARWLFPLWLFLALFTKGPYGLMIPLCGTVVFLIVSGEIRHVFRYWGWSTWLVLVVLCGLWFGAVYLEGGTEYLDNLLFHQTVGRAVNSFHHKAPFYYYCISIWYSIAPWSPLVIFVIVLSLIPKLRRRLLPCLENNSLTNSGDACIQQSEGGVSLGGVDGDSCQSSRRDDFWCRNNLLKFFLCIGITTFVVLSCISSKLQIYLLPAFPFLIYSAAMLMPGFKVWEKMEKALRWIGIGMLAIVFVAGWFTPMLNPYIGYGDLCSKALEVSQKYEISDFRTWHVRRSENMDVYLHRDVTVIPDDDLPIISGVGEGCPAADEHDNLQENVQDGGPFLLMVATKYLDQLPEMETYVVGPYAVLVYNECKYE